MNKQLKGALIALAAIVLTTVSLEASDFIVVRSTSLLGNVTTGVVSVCGAGEVKLQVKERTICVDAFEAVPSPECPYQKINSHSQTEESLANRTCKPESSANRDPWQYVSFTTAQQLCARAGKRLPTASEWYRYSLGVQDETTCVYSKTAPLKTGESNCVTPLGVYDGVGNLWEWVEATVASGTYEGRLLPENGYVTAVDSEGVVTETDFSKSPSYGNDYAITSGPGTTGIIRGGFYGSGEDGGLFAINTTAQLSLATAGIGFRCVQDIEVR